MKRVRLIRSVGVPGATDRDGDVVTVCDADATALLAGDFRLGPAAVVVEDLGPDRPHRPVTVRVVRPTSVNGSPAYVGAVVDVAERDARLLVALGKAERVDAETGGA